jgi:hypothetical protein
VYTVLWYSLLGLAWGAIVTVLNVLGWLFLLAVLLFATIAVGGALVLAGIGVRRLIARHSRADSGRSPAEITPPIVVADNPDCRFYQSAADALAVGFTPTAKVFDAQGHRLLNTGSALRISPTVPDAAAELAAVLRQWLNYMDALRCSTADMDLATLVWVSVEHGGYSLRRSDDAR